MTRIALALSALLGTIVLAGASFASLLSRPWVALLAGQAVLLSGFLGLQLTRTAATPYRPLRLALGIGFPINAYILYGLSFPSAPPSGRPSCCSPGRSSSPGW